MLIDTIPDLATEITAGDTLSIIEIAKQFRVAPSTIYRWMFRGLPDGKGERVRLQAIRRGKIWLTSRAALQRFLTALPQSRPTSATPPLRTPARRQRDCERARKNLKEQYGI